MVDLTRFDNKVANFESEASRNKGLVETVGRIRGNIEKTRNYKITTEKFNVLMSNRRNGLIEGADGKFVLHSPEEALDILADLGDPLSLGIKRRARECMDAFPSPFVMVYSSLAREPLFFESGLKELLIKLYDRTMTEKETLVNQIRSGIEERLETLYT